MECRRAAGILHDDFVRIKSRYKKPVVLIDSYAPRDIMNYVNVGLEDERGAYEMTCHLLEKGHRRIAFLADNMEGVDYTRYVGHQKAMAEYGLKADEKDLLIIRSGMMERESSLEELYYLSRNYTAFMCCSDYHAVVLMSYFSDRGVRIPDDLSFTGFDDVLLARIVRPALTTVRQDITRKGCLAVDTLLGMIQEEESPKWDVKLPIEIVFRDSVKTISSYGGHGHNETKTE